MGLALKRFKTYAKLAVMAAIALLVLLVILFNWGEKHQVTVWLFHEFSDVNVLWVMLVSGVAAVLIAWVLGWVRRVVRDLRELRKAKEAEAREAEQRRREEKLKEQESRIDAKIQGAIGGDGDSADEH